MWSAATRRQHARDDLICPSDLRDEEFALLEPLFPRPKRRGRRPTPLRRVLNAVLYVLRTACPWRCLPRCYPPRSTVQSHFYAWRDAGLLTRAAQLLCETARSLRGRDPSPSGCIVDSQSVRTSESGGPLGFDAGKRVRGRKRHIAVDSDGLLLAAAITPADVQDRDGVQPVIADARRVWPSLRKVTGDAAYAGPVLAKALAPLTVVSVKRPDFRKNLGERKWQTLPKRWLVERTFAHIGRNRRLTRDLERSLETSNAWLMLAAAIIVVRRVTLPKQT